MGDVSHELIERLKILSPRDGDVFVIEVEKAYLDDEDQRAEAQAFAEEVQKVTGRDVFVIAEGYKLAAVEDPRGVQA